MHYRGHTNIQYSTIIQTEHTFGAVSISEKGVKLGQNFHILGYGEQTNRRIYMP